VGTIATLAFVAAISTACGVTPTSPGPVGEPTATAVGAAATSCGGSHTWPPPGLEAPLPVGVIVDASGPDEVRVRNQSGETWQFEVATWVDAPCVGTIAEVILRSGPIDPGHELTTNVTSGTGPGPGGPKARIGIAAYRSGCGEACTDAPIGFGWIDVLVRPVATD
jgi:hypothetical protein